MMTIASLGCPYCQGPLEPSTGAGGPEYECLTCGRHFGAAGLIPALVRQEDADRLASFSQAYHRARLDDGWRPFTAQEAQALPYPSASAGYPLGAGAFQAVLYWAVRAESFRAFMSWLAREGPSPAAGPIADLGAGTGWLSYRLAQLGFDVLSIDASLDSAFGLGAAQAFYSSQVPLTLAQGDLEHPPLLYGACALILFNASLHYAADLERTLRRAAHALRPGGCVVALDTPIARQPRPGTDRGDRHLGRQELNDALTRAGLRPRWIPVRRGSRWWFHQARAWLKRESQFSFPMVVAYSQE